jgi:hypothetical protein
MFGLGFIGIDPLTRGGNVWVGSALLLAGTASAILLILHSRSQRQPIVPFDLLRNPVFSLSVATSIASSAADRNVPIRTATWTMVKPFPSKTHIGNHMLHPETLMLNYGYDPHSRRARSSRLSSLHRPSFQDR